MNPSPSIESIFHAARELPEAEREAYLLRACADDAVRDRVEALLQADEAAGQILPGFLEGAAAEDATRGASNRQNSRGPSEAAGVSLGRYKLLQEIGEGGFGTVWMAEQLEPVRRKVALKVIKLGMDTKQVVARFEVERQALALMDHPNIAKVHDGGVTPGGRPYFVMELVKGVPITDYCDQAGLSTPDRLALFQLVCLAVQHAHQKGVIHRDIKPSNILVTLHDGIPVPKVIDFGIAKATSSELTQKTLFTEYQQMIGTPEYMAPEQAEMSGLDVDTRADVYSLGVLLYEMLTGTKPFDAHTLAQQGYLEMLRVIREEEPPRPSTRISTLGEQLSVAARQRRATPNALSKLLRGDVDWIVMKALEKDRTRRYATASDLAADIARYMSDEPVHATPPSTVYRLRKYVRRHRVGVTAGVAVGLALVLGLSAAVWGYVSADEQRELAQRAEATAIGERDAAQDAREAAEAAEAVAKQATARSEAQRRALQVRDEKLKAIEYADVLRDVVELHDRGRFARAKELLEATDADHRGFAWQYLYSRGAGFEEQDKVAQLDYDLAVDWSPDGRHVALCWVRDEKVWLTVRSLVDEKDLWKLPVTLKAFAKFSPDGARVLRVEGDAAGTMALHDVRSGEEIVQGRFGSAVGPRPYSDGNWKGMRPGLFGPAAFSPAPGGALVLGGLDGSLRRFDPKDLRRLEDFSHFEANDVPVSVVRFARRGERLVVADDSGLARVIDARTGAVQATVKHSAGSRQVSILDADLSPDGRLLFLNGAGGRATVWEVATGELVQELERHREPGTSQSYGSAARFSEDGRFALTAGTDSRVLVYSTDSWRQVTALHGYVASFARTGTVMQALGSKRYKTWNLDEHLAQPIGSMQKLNGLRITPDGRYAFTVNRGAVHQCGLRKWDLRDGSQVFARLGHEFDSLAVDVSPDGKRVAIGCVDMRVVIVRAADGKRLRELRVPWSQAPKPGEGKPDFGIWRVRFSPDPDSTLLAAGPGTTNMNRDENAETPVILFDTAAGSSRQLAGIQGGIWGFGFAPDGSKLAACGQREGKAVTISWDVATGRQLASFSSSDRWLTDVCFSPDGKAMVVAGQDPHDRGVLLELDLQGQVRWQLSGHRRPESGVRRIEYLDGGRRLVTLDGERQLCVWDIRSQQRLLTVPLLEQDEVVYSLDVSPDGRRILAGSLGDERVQVFEIERHPGASRRRNAAAARLIDELILNHGSRAAVDQALASAAPVGEIRAAARRVLDGLVVPPWMDAARRAWVHQSKGRDEQARLGYLEAVQLGAPAWGPQFRLAQLASFRYDRAAAARHLSAAVQPVLELLERDPAARLDLDQRVAILLTPNIWARLGDFDAAQRALADIETSRRHGRGWTFLNNKGLALMRFGQWEQARQLLVRAILHNPHPTSSFNLVYLELRRGEARTALARAKNAVARWPNYLAGRLALGAAKVMAGDADSALPDFEAALAQQSKNTRPQAGTAWACYLFAVAHRHGMATARTKLKEFTDLWHLEPCAFHQSAWFLATVAQGTPADREAAVQHGRRAVELSGGRSPHARATLAEALFRAGKRDEAIREAEATLRDMPPHGVDWLTVEQLKTRIAGYRK